MKLRQRFHNFWKEKPLDEQKEMLALMIQDPDYDFDEVSQRVLSKTIESKITLKIWHRRTENIPLDSWPKKYSHWYLDYAKPYREQIIQSLSREQAEYFLISNQRLAQLDLAEFTSIKEEDFLLKLLKHPSSEVRASYAKNQHCPLEHLRILSHDSDDLVRETLASYMSFFDAEIFESLVVDADEVVRKNIYENPYTPESIRKKLYEDESELVKCSIANCTVTPLDILSKLAYDELWEVRLGVAHNQNASSEVLSILAKDKNVNVRGAVASNFNTSTDDLTMLSLDASYLIQSGLAKNPNTPVDVIKKMCSEFFDDNYPILLTESLSQNPNVPQSLLRNCWKSRIKKSVSLAINLWKNPSTPQDVKDEIQKKYRML